MLAAPPTPPARPFFSFPFPCRAGPPPSLSPSLPLPFPAPAEPPPPPPRHSPALPPPPPPGAEPWEPRPRPASVTERREPPRPRMRAAATAEGAVGRGGRGQGGSVGLWPPQNAAGLVPGGVWPLQAASAPPAGVSVGVSLRVKSLGWCALSSKRSDKSVANCRHFLPSFPLNVS